MSILPKLAFAITCMGLLHACSSKKEDLNAPPLSDYFPISVGKQLTYRLDSTVLTQFGEDTITKYYRVRHTVDREITDALGRKAYAVFLSLSDSAGITPYKPINTFMTVPSGTDWIENVENNLRFMKLRFPIIEGFEWPGNSFISTSSTSSPKTDYLADWIYTYQNVGKPFTVRGRTFENTITVLQRNEEFPQGPFSPSQPFKQWDYSIEVYAKDIGLIYKNFDHKVWQGPSPGSTQGYWEDDSYRIVLQLVDYN